MVHIGSSWGICAKMVITYYILIAKSGGGGGAGLAVGGRAGLDEFRSYGLSQLLLGMRRKGLESVHNAQENTGLTLGPSHNTIARIVV
jgi:hypothetical protein